MLSKIIDSLCSCKNQQENEKSVIKITFPEPTTSELLKPTFSKFKISDNNDKLNSSKSNVISKKKKELMKMLFFKIFKIKLIILLKKV